MAGAVAQYCICQAEPITPEQLHEAMYRGRVRMSWGDVGRLDGQEFQTGAMLEALREAERLIQFHRAFFDWATARLVVADQITTVEASEHFRRLDPRKAEAGLAAG